MRQGVRCIATHEPTNMPHALCPSIAEPCWPGSKPTASTASPQIHQFVLDFHRPLRILETLRPEPPGSLITNADSSSSSYCFSVNQTHQGSTKKTMSVIRVLAKEKKRISPPPEPRKCSGIFSCPCINKKNTPSHRSLHVGTDEPVISCHKRTRGVPHPLGK